MVCLPPPLRPLQTSVLLCPYVPHPRPHDHSPDGDLSLLLQVPSPATSSCSPHDPWPEAFEPTQREHQWARALSNRRVTQLSLNFLFLNCLPTCLAPPTPAAT